MSDIPDILSKIVKNKRKRVDILSANLSKIKDAAFSPSAPIDFLSALSKKNGFSLICEVKKASPSAGIICDKFQPAKFAKSYADAGADAISVLTEEDFFLGSTEDLKSARVAASQTPILRKDFIFSEVQVYESRMIGADSFLLICAILDKNELTRMISLGRSLKMEPLVEAHDRKEVDKALSAGAKIIGINNRDLRTFKVELETSKKLSKYIPGDIIKVSESGIKDASDCKFLMDLGFHAALVGETFMRTGTANLSQKIKSFKNIPYEKTK